MNVGLDEVFNPRLREKYVSLAVDDLTVYYRSLRGDVKAVDGVTFEIADGEIMGLAGESGCGKSTLGKSLIRMDARMRYVDGHVELDGAELPIWDDAEMTRSVSRRSRSSRSTRRARSTRRGGSARWPRTCSRRADVAREGADGAEAAARARGPAADVLARFPMELSGGMKQRVVMVLSSLLDPSLLIADEVTSALDVSSQRAVAELLVEFRDRGFVKSIIVITHDLSVLYQIADTILVMYAGKLAEKAPAGDDGRVAEAPVHAAAALDSLPEVGVRFAEQRLTASPGRPPSLLDPPAAAASRPAARSRSSSARGAAVRAARAGPRGRLLEGRRLMLLELDTCCKTYRTGAFGRGELLAVRDVTFAVEAGEVVSLIGESGSGKSTVGKMILRLLRPRRRRIRFDGFDISKLEGRQLKEYYRDVQGVFQDPFSSYNPIFKADRVFALVRSAYFPATPTAEWQHEARGVARSGEPQPRRRARQVPAPAVRRPAPAHADRAGAAARHPPARRRRDHLDARRLDPYRRPQPARRPEGARPRRSSSSRTTCRSATTSATDGDHAPRRRRRDGRDRARLRQPAAPVHEGAARVACRSCTRSGRTSTRRPAPRSPGRARRSSSRSRTTTSSRRMSAACALGGAPAPASRGRSARRVERRRLALEPQPDHPARLIPRANSIFNSAVVPLR